MKKTLVVIMAMAGVAVADVQDGYLTNPGALTWEAIDTLTTTAISGGNTGLEWSSENGANLTKSWELSFDLSVKSIDGLSDEIFGTNGGSGSGAYGWVLNVGSNGQVFLTNGRSGGEDYYVLLSTPNDSFTLGADAASYGESVNVTLSFTKYVNIETNEAAGGLFTLTVGNETVSATIDTNANTIFYEGNSLTRLWTNGGKQKMENIALKEGGVMYIPEPTTAMLSLLALSGLAIRRRRWA